MIGWTNTSFPPKQRFMYRHTSFIGTPICGAIRITSIQIGLPLILHRVGTPCRCFLFRPVQETALGNP